jgi:CxxC-x17-CxxC domain-containing protein
VPSFSTVVRGGFSEIKKTKNIIPFDDYWNDKEVLDLVKYWDVIKGTKRAYEVKCAKCGFQFEVTFKPREGQKLYCRKCRTSD